jgi:hypothetical protein
MVMGTVERIFDPAVLDRVFQDHAVLGYFKRVQSLHSTELRGFCIGEALISRFSYGICDGAALKESAVDGVPYAAQCVRPTRP